MEVLEPSLQRAELWKIHLFTDLGKQSGSRGFEAAQIHPKPAHAVSASTTLLRI